MLLCYSNKTEFIVDPPYHTYILNLPTTCLYIVMLHVKYPHMRDWEYVITYILIVISNSIYLCFLPEYACVCKVSIMYIHVGT